MEYGQEQLLHKGDSVKDLGIARQVE